MYVMKQMFQLLHHKFKNSLLFCQREQIKTCKWSEGPIKRLYEVSQMLHTAALHTCTHPLLKLVFSLIYILSLNIDEFRIKEICQAVVMVMTCA